VPGAPYTKGYVPVTSFTHQPGDIVYSSGL